MRVAYVIVAHTLPDLVVRVVRALAAPGCTFHVHYDRKAPDEEARRIAAGLCDVPGVTMMPRIDVHWAGIGPVRVALSGVSAALADGADVAVLLSGQDYPIKPPGEVLRALEPAAGRPHIQHTALPSDRFPGETGRFERWYFASRRLTLPPPNLWFPYRRRFPAGLRPWRGSAYWALPRDCLAHIESVTRDDARLVRFFNHVFAADEMFFQTLVMNSPYAGAAVDDDLHFMDWAPGAMNPAVLTRAHLPAMAESRFPFARKIDPRIDPGLLDAIDRDLRGEGA